MASRQPRRLSRLGKEEAGLWVARIKKFEDAWDEHVSTHSCMVYRNAVKLKLPQIGSAATGSPLAPVRQVDVHLAHRIHGWFQSEAYDEFPELRYPRDGAGDRMAPDLIEQVLTKTLDRADAIRAFRVGATDVMTDGCMSVWFGLPNEPTGADVEAMAAGPDEVFMQVMATVMDEQGNVIYGTVPPYQATEGQDHVLISNWLMTEASTADRMAGYEPEVQAALMAAAVSHLEQMEDERKNPRDFLHERGRLWANHFPVGERVAWDTSVWDDSDHRWRARKLLLDPDVAQTHPTWDPVARKRLRGTVQMDAEGALVRTEHMPSSDVEDQNSKVEVWEIWDRKYQTRHYVPRGVSEGDVCYLEVDESNPYEDPNTGESRIHGFFPCAIWAPLKTNERTVHRTFGLPVFEAGWPYIRQIVSYETAIDGMLKAFKRHIGMHPDLHKNVVLRNALLAGTDVVYPLPSEFWERADETGLRVNQWPQIPREILAERDRLLSMLSVTTGIPRSALTGAPVADTLGQEEIAESAQGAQTADLVRSGERAFGELAERVLPLLRGSLSNADVAEMLGVGFEEKWGSWEDMPDVYAKIDVIFSSRARDENPVKVQQLMQAIQVAEQDIDPVWGTPRVDRSVLFDRLYRYLDVGDIGAVELSDQDKMKMLVDQMQAQEAAQAGGAPQGGAKKPGAPDRPSPNDNEGPPDRGDVAGGAGTVG